MMMSDADREAYDNHFMSMWKRTSEMKTKWMDGHDKGVKEGIREGRKEGRIEGRAEGERKKSLEIARKMKAMGIDLPTITSATGLTEEELSQLQ